MRNKGEIEEERGIGRMPSEGRTRMPSALFRSFLYMLRTPSDIDWSTGSSRVELVILDIKLPFVQSSCEFQVCYI